MPKGYKHVTYDKRCQIYTLKATGISNRKIGVILGIHRSTVGNEMKRNSGLKGYRYKQADKKAKSRRSNASYKPTKMTEDFKIELKNLLIAGWSPEQISGRLKLTKKFISHETIYKWIWADKRSGGNLYTLLRHKAKKYNKRKNKTAGRGLIPNRVGIEKRPAIVEEKSRIGDIEIDTVIGKQKVSPVLVTAVDRHSKYVVVKLAQNKTAEKVTEQIIKGLSALPHPIRTLTFDNGKEFAKHEKIALALKANCYFAHAYCSWERGLNEHTNGLIRQIFPKGMDFSKLTEAAVQKVENWLNLRPRKSLNYLTPFEVMHNTKINLQSVALQN